MTTELSLLFCFRCFHSSTGLGAAVFQRHRLGVTLESGSIGKPWCYLCIDIESDQAASVTAATRRARGKSVNNTIARIPRRRV